MCASDVLILERPLDRVFLQNEGINKKEEGMKSKLKQVDYK